jgi:hypothetical protein
MTEKDDNALTVACSLWPDDGGTDPNGGSTESRIKCASPLCSFLAHLGDTVCWRHLPQSVRDKRNLPAGFVPEGTPGYESYTGPPC